MDNWFLFMQLSVHLWVTGEESLSFSSFLVIREMASKLHSRWYDTCLVKTYKAFVAHSKFFKPTKMKHLKFLQDTIIELYSIDIQKSYQQVLASLQQLAKSLQLAIRTMMKEDLKRVRNWQYINCISLWVKFICCNFKEHDIESLLSLCILVLKGMAYLFPGPRYVPLRFRCMQMLNQLSLSSGVFIPVASLFFDCLEYKGKEIVTDSTHGWAIAVSNLANNTCTSLTYLALIFVRLVPKNLVKSQSFQKECVLSAIELLSAHFLQWSHHISFPELATFPLILLRRFHDKLTDNTLHRQVKRFVDQILDRCWRISACNIVEQNREFIEKKRDGVSFSPNDQVAIDSFIQKYLNGRICASDDKAQ
ncbi:Nucleolar complex protein 2 like [Apostasia shenzhenica]|uniref:Nucleolar complex protein 2 like n=1 Tax=Apostasia shenzhenica TaxID=1088818 RepID=A0A2I0A3M6_9ASPA|nr:Nucleolar complex protein 2 like [Apostasia shenzhenica]